MDPEQDGLDPISVFCNTSSTPVTAVLHHNLENWTHVKGYEASGSYNAQVWLAQQQLWFYNNYLSIFQFQHHDGKGPMFVAD